MNVIKFPFQFDASKIKEEIEAVALTFETINSKHVHNDELQGAHLIFPIDSISTSDGFETSYRLSPELKQCPYILSVLDTFKCDKFNVRIHNLKAKGKIHLHSDKKSTVNNKVVRVHIPFTTTDEVYLFVDGERVPMQNGECWFFDITKPHAVENKGNEDRLNLVIDCELNDWWRNILSEHGLDEEPPSEFNKHSTEELMAMKENLSHIPGFEDNPLLKEIDKVLQRRG